MIRSRRNEILVAYALLAPFIVIYAVLFVYPSLKLFVLAFTNAPLIGSGDWVGFKNFQRLWSDRLFWTSIWNTIYFVILSVIPSTVLGLVVAIAVNRLTGWLQSLVLAAFFLPYILPVSVVYRIWGWMFDKDFGIAQYRYHALHRRRACLGVSHPAAVHAGGRLRHRLVVRSASTRSCLSPACATFRARSTKRRNSTEQAPGRQFRRITWPLIWPITVLVMTIQLILQLKIFDQVYLFAANVRTDATMVMVQYILKQAFQMNKGGLGAAASMVLFVLIVLVSVLQFQLLRARGER